MAASSDLIASGGTDEVVRIFSGKKRTDVGSLMQQQGTISWIEFYKDSHLFTGSDDGSICIWDTRNWECLKTLRGHKGPVLCLSVHPSGKMLLSVSKDRTLRTWNLIKGRLAYITNLRNTAHFVTWAPSGRHFLVAIDDRIDVYNIADGGVCCSMKFEGGKRISSIVFLSNDVIAVSADSEYIHLYHLTNDDGGAGDTDCMVRFKAHDNRVKGLFSTFNRIPAATEDEPDVYLFSLSSDGRVKLWKIIDLDSEPSLIASIDTTCRPTSFAVMIPEGSKIPEVTSNTPLVGDKMQNAIDPDSEATGQFDRGQKRKQLKDTKGTGSKKKTLSSVASSSKTCPTKVSTNV